MATLTSLPAELLLLTTSHLDNQKDILNLASTTRALHALLYPHAFTSLILDEGSVYQLTRLVHVLARNPHCARAVRILQFDDLPRVGSRVRKEEKVKYDPEVIRPVLERMASALSSSSNTMVAKWEDVLRTGDDTEPWIALILTLVPNVEDLSLTFNYLSFYIRKLFSMMDTATETGGASSALPGPGSPTKEPQPLVLFSRLRTLSARWYDTENGVSSSYLLPFFRLPSLREFNGVSITDGRPADEYELRGDGPPEDCYYYDEDEEPYPEYDEDPEGYFRRYPGDEGFSNVTHITLSDSNSEHGFPDLIRACRRLVSFVYEHGERGGTLGWFAPRRFHGSLCKHKDWLEELTICYDNWACGHGDPLESEFIGSFKDFKTLKRLRLRGENILVREGKMPFDLLPPSLESLLIEEFAADNGQNLLGQLRELRSVVELQCPNLVSLRVAGYSGETQPQEDGWPRYLEPTRGDAGETCAIELVDCA
ncbi:hypothetical protein BJY00DRAFT_184515 [Aspergillus carlsbadensis]|nr:hypothetical protein BJY00DRAFT_184515 [Aspergillus carlsbadensis]